MDNRDRLLNDLAVENMNLRIANMQMNYEIEALRKQLEQVLALEGAQNGNTQDNTV